MAVFSRLGADLWILVRGDCTTTSALPLDSSWFVIGALEGLGGPRYGTWRNWSSCDDFIKENTRDMTGQQEPFDMSRRETSKPQWYWRMTGTGVSCKWWPSQLIIYISVWKSQAPHGAPQIFMVHPVVHHASPPFSPSAMRQPSQVTVSLKLLAWPSFLCPSSLPSCPVPRGNMGVEPAIIRETGDNHGDIIDGSSQSSLKNIWDVE